MADSDSLFVQLAIQRGLATQQTANECIAISTRDPGQRLAILVAQRAAIPQDVARRLLTEAEEIARNQAQRPSDLQGYVSDTNGFVQPAGFGANPAPGSSGFGATPHAPTPTPHQQGGPQTRNDWKTVHGTPAHAVVSPTALQPGALFNRYRLESELGRGGMGVVWKARQSDLDRDVAIKMLLQGALASEKLRGRFVAEAKAVARLVHPNVVTVHDVGDHGGILFFTMDFVDGPSLAQFLKTQSVGVKRALELALGIAEGLDHAHKQGIVHRDLKPANILIDPRGTPRITDFGIAKDAQQISTTVPGEVLGTPSYMSPEQADGNAHGIDGRADIYSLGAIIYRILTGAPPFTGETNYDIIQRVLHDPLVPLRKKAKGIPPEVDALVVKCLQRRREDRYASATEVAKQIRKALRRYDRETHERRAPDGHRRLAIVLVAAGLVALAGAVAFVQHRKNQQLEARLERDRLERDRLAAQEAEQQRRDAANDDLASARSFLESQPEQALAKARAAAAVLTDDAEAQILLSRLLLEVEQNPEAALTPVSAALALEPNRVDGLQLKGRCLLALDRPEKEVEAIARTLEKAKTGPARAAAAELRCDLALERNQVSVAVVHLDQAVRNAANDPRIRLRMARLLVKARRFATAEEAATQAIDLDPGSAEAHALRAQARLGLDKPKDAERDAAAALERDPRSALAAEVQREAREKLNAQKKPPRVPANPPPTSPQSQHQYVHSLLDQAIAALQRRDLTRARQFLAQANKLEPAPSCKKEIISRIKILNGTGGYEAAMREAERYKASHPGDPVGPELLLQANLAAGRFPEAIALASELISQRPQQPTLYAIRAKALEANNQLDRALEDLNRLVALAPAGNHSAPHSRAHLLAKLQRFDEALLDTETCLKLVSTHGHYLFMRAEYLLALGRKAEAKSAFEAALAQRLSSAEQRSAREKLQELNGS